MKTLVPFFAILILSGIASSQNLAFRGQITVVHRSRHKSGNSDVVLWLTPAFLPPAAVSVPAARLVQKDKRFAPHVIAIRVGTEIEFPNQDPFFHDVFSIYRGKPFDLGLYESGTARKIRFSQPGVSYIFCNIHPQMSAVVVAVPTPYFAVTDADGNFQISHIPQGRYKVEFWYESASEVELSSLTHDIDLGLSIPFLTVTLHSSDQPTPHLNKYGQEYGREGATSY
jgi:plastocyanin